MHRKEAAEGRQTEQVGEEQQRVQVAETSRVLNRRAHEDERAERRQTEQPHRTDDGEARPHRLMIHSYHWEDTHQLGEIHTRGRIGAGSSSVMSRKRARAR